MPTTILNSKKKVMGASNAAYMSTTLQQKS